MTNFDFASRFVRFAMRRTLLVGFDGKESAVLVTGNLCRRYDDMDMLVVDLALVVTGAVVEGWSGYSLTHTRRQQVMKGCDMWEISIDEMAAFVADPGVRGAKGLGDWVNGRGVGLPLAVREFWAYLALAPNMPADLKSVWVPPGLDMVGMAKAVALPHPAGMGKGLTLGTAPRKPPPPPIVGREDEGEEPLEEARRKAGHK